MVEGFAQSKGLTLTVHHKTEFPRLIETDEARLKEILIELLGCGIKLTHYGTVTLVTKTTNNDQIKWSITGTGLNLSEATVSSTLDILVTNQRDKRKPRICLFVAKPLIEAFGGTFKVRSKSGRLSYIGFTLPVTVHKEEAPQRYIGDCSIAIDISEETKCECPRILVVDSNPMNQFVVSSLFDKLKVQYKIAHNAISTLNLIEERLVQDCCQYYSLVLIDSGIEGGCAEVYTVEYK